MYIPKTGQKANDDRFCRQIPFQSVSSDELGMRQIPFTNVLARNDADLQHLEFLYFFSKKKSSPPLFLFFTPVTCLVVRRFDHRLFYPRYTSSTINLVKRLGLRNRFPLHGICSYLPSKLKFLSYLIGSLLSSFT